MKQTALPGYVINLLKRRILDTDMLHPDYSFDTVFDDLADKAMHNQYRELSIQLHDLAKSMQTDLPPVKYQNLIDAGFDDDTSRQISAHHRPFTQEEWSLIQFSQGRDDFLDKLSQTRPFLASRIKKLEENIHNSIFVVDRLQKMGFPQSVIDNYILYKSMRPRSTMSGMIRIPKGKSVATRFFGSDSNVLIDASWINKIAEVHQDSLLPVVRYGQGMSKGFYTQEYNRKIDDEFCGTFYYYEIDSEIMLNARDILICPNKICAAAYFLGIDEVVRMFASTITIGNQKYSEYRVEHVFDTKIFGTSWNKIISDMVSGRYDFMRFESAMYALEDRFDQVICDEARDKGFDIVILTTMTGQERIVTEILDTRPREVSLNSLVIIQGDF